MKGKNIDIIYSSSKIRVKETSEILNKVLGCPVIILKELEEQDIYGAYVELGKNKPEEEYRILGELLADDTSIKGIESYTKFKERVKKGFDEIVESKYYNVLIVTHGGPIRCIFREIFELGELSKISNGAILEMNLEDTCSNMINMDGAKFKEK